MANNILNKLSLKQKIAISLVITHLVFVAFAFYRDNQIFADPESCKMYPSGDVGMPFPLLMISDAYFVLPAIVFDSSTEDIPKFIKLVGTGGPCTYISVNPALPYSLVFVLLSSAVYYLVGLIIGSVVEHRKTFRMRS